MSLERLVDEIRQRAEAEIAREAARLETEKAGILKDRDQRIGAIRTEGDRQTELEVSRERAQRLARAKLEARKRVFETRERRMGQLLGAAKGLLKEFARSEEYAPLLKRLYAYATQALGKQVKVRGRSEDASLLKSIAKGNFVDDPLPIAGGLVAETPDGARRLNLSFDELLRLHEDEVRDLLAA